MYSLVRAACVFARLSTEPPPPFHTYHHNPPSLKKEKRSGDTNELHAASSNHMILHGSHTFIMGA
jgi:hypothetical protein